MIVILVEHFLNEEGQQFFPQWMKQTEAVMKKYEGFLSLRQIQAVDNPNACHLLIEFENLEWLKRWSSSAEHKEYIDNMLEPYRLKPHQAQIFKVV